MLDVAVVLRTAGQGVRFHGDAFGLRHEVRPATLARGDAAHDVGNVCRTTCEHLTACDTASLQRALSGATDFFERTSNGEEVSAGQQGSRQRVTEQLTSSVQWRSSHSLAQERSGSRQYAQGKRHLCWDTFHALDQDVSRNAGSIGINHGVAVFTIDLELNNIIA